MHIIWHNKLLRKADRLVREIERVDTRPFHIVDRLPKGARLHGGFPPFQRTGKEPEEVVAFYRSWIAYHLKLSWVWRFRWFCNFAGGEPDIYHNPTNFYRLVRQIHAVWRD